MVSCTTEARVEHVASPHFCVEHAAFPPLASHLQLNPRSLEAFDGPYDLWEEAAKEALELVLDAANQPMILLDRFVR